MATLVKKNIVAAMAYIIATVAERKKCMETGIANYRIDDMQSKIKMPPLDIMLVGVTGAGKSSTINALLGNDAAKIGYGTDPETKDIAQFSLNKYIRLLDTPGLGDSPEKDRIYLQKIASYLNRDYKRYGEKCGKLVDMVLVIIDGSRRDFSEIYSLLNDTIFPNIKSENVLFVINQADQAMKGRHWENGKPDQTLSAFLEEQAESVQKRIEESTGQKIRRPLCYSATNDFNIYSLIDYIWNNIAIQRKMANGANYKVFCSNCGVRLEDNENARFCSKCGAKL